MRDRRNRLSPAAVLLAVCLLTAFLGKTSLCSPSPRSSSATALDSSQPAEAVPGEILVKFKEPVLAAAQVQMEEAFGFQELGGIEELGVVRVGIEPGLTPEDAARLYEARPEVEYAEPNYILRSDGIPDDPLFVSQQQWYYDLIQAPPAWDIETGDPSVVVAVLDTGVDTGHPDLKDSIWTNPAEVAANNKDDDGNGCVDDIHGCNFAPSISSSCHYKNTPNSEIGDDDGHGTFVAGIIAARANNQIGVAGTAPNVTIMPVKVLDCVGAGTAESAAAGVLYAARSGARILNVSFGGDQDSKAVRDAIEQAHDVYGAVIVSSAGNTGSAQVAFPARLDEVIGVSASDHNNPDAKTTFSNWGPGIDVAVPGVDIVSTLPQRLCGEDFPCIGGQPYATGKGTSFSAALVSGAAALILSRSPTLSPDEVARHLIETAAPMPDGSFAGWAGSGRIQIAQALQSPIYRVGVSGVVKN
ncbi:MAG: S8 family serine peptidase [Dehalococcoidia bacterium]|nr:S8 family serine peptidase [Dehalococcoidia bacterium]